MRLRRVGKAERSIQVATSFNELMKTAILSDVHGNLEALDAVLSDLEEFTPDRIVCLGDMIGYGPDPEAVISKVAAHGISCVLGNHEAALSSEKALNWMNFLARENNQGGAMDMGAVPNLLPGRMEIAAKARSSVERMLEIGR